MVDNGEITSVQVAVRIRPSDEQLPYAHCARNEPKIILADGKSFVFDYVYDMRAEQANIYESCIDRLVKRSLEGFNATVLAYGQTGTGKTFTMGTGFQTDKHLEGIIPRAVRQIFSILENNQLHNELHRFNVDVQFLEIYKEKIFDLLSSDGKSKTFEVMEDHLGGVRVPNATTERIRHLDDALRFLQKGVLTRTIASTNVNAQSSRSHAIFTIMIRRQRNISSENGDMCNATFTSKFHFVDLAGSESLVEATSTRRQEGILINKGLLQLGIVISELARKAQHISYRSSKLTRLLQDSLGGNSATVLIACISPNTKDCSETLRTLNQISRARKITNHLHINQDHQDTSSSLIVRELNDTIARLREENAAYCEEVETMRKIMETLQKDNATLRKENLTLQKGREAVKKTGANCKNVGKTGANGKNVVKTGANGENVENDENDFGVGGNTGINANSTVGSRISPQRRCFQNRDKTFNVERILQHYEDDEGGFVYRVEWEGYDSSYNEWIPEKNFKRGNIILVEYKKKLKYFVKKQKE